MTREEAILWLQVLKHSQINWVGEQAEDEDIIARCEEAEQEAFDMAIEALSADAVQGEWIWRTDIPIGDGRTSAGYICSHCGKDYWHGNKLKFCPNCGAKMKGGDDE